MAVISNNVLGIGGNCAVDKLIVIHILLNQSKMDIGLLKLGRMEASDSFHHVVGNLLGSLRHKDFLVFNQYLGIDTKCNVAT